MWEIANAMITWELCCDCWVVLEHDYTDIWIPVRCDWCQPRGKKNSPVHWIYSESRIDEIAKSKNKVTLLLPMVAYNFEVKSQSTKGSLRTNNNLFQYIAEFAVWFHEMMSEPEDLWTCYACKKDLECEVCNHCGTSNK